MGKHATHAVVYAQLYTPDGQCQGLHSFIVQVEWKYRLSFFSSWGEWVQIKDLLLCC